MNRYSKTAGAVFTVAVLLSCAAICGCTTRTGARSALPAQRQSRLLRRARLPSELGIQSDAGKGLLSFENLHSIPIGTQSTAGFTPRAPLQTASFPLINIGLNGQRCTAALSTAMPVSLTDYQHALTTKITPLAQAPEPESETEEWRLLRRETQVPFERVHDYPALSRSLHMGSLIMYNVPVGIVDDTRGLAILPQVPEAPIDVILGDDFLKAFARVTIDFPARKIAMASRGVHRPEPKHLAAAGRFDESFDLPAMQAMFGGRGPFPVVLDTAGDFGLLLPTHLAQKLDLLEDGRKRTAFGTRTRSVPCWALGKRTLDLSGFEIAGVTGLAVEVSPEELPYAMLGNDVLKHFIVTIDYGTKRVYFEASDLPTM